MRFHLRQAKNSQNPLRAIYIRVTVDGKREEWSTQRRCEKQQWNVASGRVIGKNENARSINVWLESLNLRAHECRQQLFSTHKPFTALHIHKLMQGEELEPARMLSETWAYYFQYIAGLIGKDYVSGTLQKYQAAYKALKKYTLLKFGAEDIRLDALDFQFIKNYEYYLKTDYGLCNNTAVQMVKKLRTMIRVALNFNWLQKDPFMAHRMHTEEVYRDYLTGEELRRLAAKNFRTRKLTTVRDLFLFSCYTGLAYVDTVKLSKDDLITGEDGEQWIQTHRVKNNNRVRVPLLPPALALIQYYDGHPLTPEGQLFPGISNQRANSSLKEIAQKLGLKKKLTYHCARHTFATTVTLTNGVPLETVGQMLGHKTIRTTQHYARVTDTKIRIDMQPLKERYQEQMLLLPNEFEP